MATRTNKYASINFNHLFHNNSHSTAATTASSSAPSSSSSSTSDSYKSHLAATRTHGGMLVLSRPTPKAQPQLPPPQKQQPPPQKQQPPPPPIQARPEQDSLALLPLGRAEAGSPSPSSPSKPDRFVPPHLRPGFVGREEKPGLEFQIRPNRQGNFGSPNRYGEERRPKSGGHERMRRGDESDQGELSRPRSSGTRPNSSG
ncbi:hypothetical protein AAG906_039863 [Vitis piasezkii]